MLNNIKAKLKGALKSATIWFNTVGLVLLTAALGEPMLLAYLTDHGLVVVILVGNMILRFSKTTKALEHK